MRQAADRRAVIGIVQARMNSSRLPGKVMMPLAGEPLLGRLLDRLALCQMLDRVCVATTTNPSDAPIVALCLARRIACHRGSETDVLSRFHDAAIAHRAQVIVRITGDCPLLDPAIVDAHVRMFLQSGTAVDYIWCGDPPTLPNGMTCEVFSMAALRDAHRNATQAYDREHVTPYLRRPGSAFRIAAYALARPLPSLRLSVDTPEDLELVRTLWNALQPRGTAFSLDDIADELARHPEWRLINSHIAQTTGPHRPGGEAL